jgi:hypothetical protein
MTTDSSGGFPFTGLSQLDNHALGFRPSHFGELDACIHHESGEAGEAAERGTRFHMVIGNLLNISTWVAPAELPEVAFALNLVSDYLKQCWRIFAVELQIDILNEFGEPITHGTIDLVLERNGEFLIIDWKTGDKGRHDLQLHGYGMAFMDFYPQAENVRGVLAYVDLQETVGVYLSYSISSTNVLLLYDKWLEKERHPYVIGTQCDWCGLRAKCPAWAASATAAFDKVNYLALNPKTGLPQGGNLVPSTVDNLKNDPTRLEEFVLAWERAKTLVEDDWGLRKALQEHIQNGFKAEHHILVNVKGKIEKTVDPEQFLERIARKVGYMKAAGAIKVDADKAIETWTNFTADPLPLQVTETEKPGYTYMRAKGKPGAGGAGAARAKRKELE